VIFVHFRLVLITLIFIRIEKKILQYSIVKFCENICEIDGEERKIDFENGRYQFKEYLEKRFLKSRSQICTMYTNPQLSILSLTFYSRKYTFEPCFVNNPFSDWNRNCKDKKTVPRKNL